MSLFNRLVAYFESLAEESPSAATAVILLTLLTAFLIAR